MHAHDRLRGLTFDEVAEYAKAHGFEDWEVIAAAPELLAAIEHALDFIAANNWAGAHDVLFQTRAAIQKAEA